MMLGEEIVSVQWLVKEPNARVISEWHDDFVASSRFEREIRSQNRPSRSAGFPSHLAVADTCTEHAQTIPQPPPRPPCAKGASTPPDPQ